MDGDAVAAGEGDAQAKALGRHRDDPGHDDDQREQEEVIALAEDVLHCIRSTAKKVGVRTERTRIATCNSVWVTMIAENMLTHTPMNSVSAKPLATVKP